MLVLNSEPGRFQLGLSKRALLNSSELQFCNSPDSVAKTPMKWSARASIERLSSGLSRFGLANNARPLPKVDAGNPGTQGLRRIVGFHGS